MNNPNRVQMKKFGGILPAQTHRAAKRFAIENGLTLNDLYELAIEEYLASRNFNKESTSAQDHH